MSVGQELRVADFNGGVPADDLNASDARSTNSLFTIVAATAALANILLWFPGIMTRDSFRQFTEARSGLYTDWHPPIMAWLWSWTLPLFPSSGAAFLIFNCVVYWGAVALLTTDLARIGHRRAALAIALIAAAPPFVVMNAFVWKDTMMAVCLLGAFAGILHLKLGGGRGFAWSAGVALLLLLAVLARSNAIIAAAPLIVYWTAAKSRLWKQLALGLAVIVAGVVFHGFVNAKLLGAHQSRAYNSLKVYDVAGVAHFSRDTSVYPVAPPLALVDRCYDPQQWDWIGRGECAALLSRQVNGARPWAESVARHPVAYLQHRFAQFNEEMFGWVPFRAFRYRDTQGDPLSSIVARPALEQEGITAHGMMASFPLLSPVLFLIAGLGAPLLAWRRLDLRDHLVQAGIFLCASATLYAGAFFLIGVANMWRYQFHSILAASVGATLILSAHARRGLAFGALEKAIAGVLAAALGVVTVARVVL